MPASTAEMAAFNSSALLGAFMLSPPLRPSLPA
nr:MAG TPA: hypothetical protein [Caudoviricetes sp.]